MNFDLAAKNLDAESLSDRLAALQTLRSLESAGLPRVGPALPSYDHVHTCASYGNAAPGVFSMSHMVWAAHEARAFSILAVEHESFAHMDEAVQGVRIVNHGMTEPLKLALAIEFRALLDFREPAAKRLGDYMLKAWGQGEAAWVVGVGAQPSRNVSVATAPHPGPLPADAGRGRSSPGHTEANHLMPKETAATGFPHPSLARGQGRAEATEESAGSFPLPSLARGEGQGEGSRPCIATESFRLTPELEQLVRQFQEAKRIRSEQNLAKLRQCLTLKHDVTLADVLTPEGNITDRQLSFAVAAAELGDVDDHTLARRASAVRRMLNPGGPAYAPFPPGLPTFQELTGRLARMGMMPTFTAQLRGNELADVAPALKSWGMAALDTAGVEPFEPNAKKDIEFLFRLAQQHGFGIVGGSDYRGVGTGWTQHAPWMDNPMLRQTIERVAYRF